MSHYCEVTLKMNGGPEAIVRALCEMDYRNGKITREDIEVHACEQNLLGYQGDTRSQKAHIILRGAGFRGGKNVVGSGSNDIGFQQKADGTWVAHVSQFDGSYYGTKWQTELLSKWAIQKIGVEAEERGYTWEVNYAHEGNKQFAYVTVNQGGW